MKKGLDCLMKRAKEYDDPFLNGGVPFIWCSNNLVTAAITHAQLYYQASGDESYLEMEAALRDWLFGCNPWGDIYDLRISGRWRFTYTPALLCIGTNERYSLWRFSRWPIYKTIYESLLGIHLRYDDAYAPFQFGAAVYHDDPGDYSSNEPTMDGTASLSFYLSTMEKTGKTQKKK